MPGMASTEELSGLRAATGPQLDVLFLQLMLRHHEGGAGMLSYAAEHAELPQVRNLAAPDAQLADHRVGLPAPAARRARRHPAADVVNVAARRGRAARRAFGARRRPFTERPHPHRPPRCGSRAVLELGVEV